MKSLQPITLDELTGQIDQRDELHLWNVRLWPLADCGRWLPERPLREGASGPVCGECARLAKRRREGKA